MRTEILGETARRRLHMSPSPYRKIAARLSRQLLDLDEVGVARTALTHAGGVGFRRFPRGSARHLFLGSVGFNRRASGEGAIRKFGINPMHQNRT
jgi:hypothetical protein